MNFHSVVCSSGVVVVLIIILCIMMQYYASICITIQYVFYILTAFL